MKNIKDAAKIGKQLDRIKSAAKRLPWTLGLHAFFVIIIFILIDVAIGGALFYKYMVLAKTENSKNAGNYIIFEYNAYKEVLDDWKAREDKFNAVVQLK